MFTEFFRKIAHKTSNAVGTAWAFVGALTIVLVWILTGPVFNFTTTWQLVINTFTTIATFLMVFLIQNTQNRESLAVQLKLDELLRAVKAARDSMINLEDLPDEELERLHNEFEKLGDRLHRIHERQKEKTKL